MPSETLRRETIKRPVDEVQCDYCEFPLADDAFFHLGLCSSNPNEDFTLVKGRESAYEWLPPRDGDFASAWKADSGGTVVSFHLANMIRKYGQPYSADGYATRMVERMRKWGFNSIGAFSGGGKAGFLSGKATVPGSTMRLSAAGMSSASLLSTFETLSSAKYTIR